MTPKLAYTCRLIFNKFIIFLGLFSCLIINASNASPEVVESNTDEIYVVSERITLKTLLKKYNLSLAHFNSYNKSKFSEEALLFPGQSFTVKSTDSNELSSNQTVNNNAKSGLLLPNLGLQTNSEDEESVSSKYKKLIEPDETVIAQGATYFAENDINEIAPQTLIKEELNRLKSEQISQVNQQINTQAEKALGLLGRSSVNLNLDEDGNLAVLEASLLAGLYEDEANLIFSQFSLNSEEIESRKRNFLNSGLGYRYMNTDYLVGANVFYDYDLSASHSRLGLGGEYWRNYLKLSANYYLPLSNWKDAYFVKEYEERPARGFDVKLQGYVPAYPQLGGSLLYEKYYGDEVAISGTNNRQRDPDNLIASIDYTPVPLLTFDVSQSINASSANDLQLGLQFNVDFNQDIQSQLSSEAMATRRTLMGSRHDLVDRNNQIVYEYRQKAFNLVIDLTQLKSAYFVDELIGLIAKHDSPSKITKFDWVITPTVNHEQSSALGATFKAWQPGEYTAHLILTNENGIRVKSNSITFNVVANDNDPQLALNFIPRTVDDGINTQENSGLSLQPNEAYKHVADQPSVIQANNQIHMTVTASDKKGPVTVPEQPRISHYINDKWTLIDLSSPYLEIISNYQDSNSPDIWHFLLTSKKEAPDEIKLKAEVNLPNFPSAEGAIYFKTPPAAEVPAQYRMTLTERGQDGQDKTGQIVFDTSAQLSSAATIKQDTYYEVTIYEMTKGSTWTDITAQVQESIKWRYWDPNIENNLNTQINVSNNGYYGLEACQGSILFSTQVNNFVNNELSWGKIGQNALTVAQKTGVAATLSEQNLQLAVQFDINSRDPNKQSVERTVCDDSIPAESSYVDYLWELANIEPEQQVAKKN